MKLKPQRCGIILSGGSGERLWPYSRAQRPKPLLSLLDHGSLLMQAVQRSILVCDETLIVTAQQQLTMTQQEVGNSEVSVIAEPEAKNTAAAIALGVANVASHNPDVLVACMPADHFITDQTAFAASMDSAFEYVISHDEIVLFGVKPSWAATSYGYIEASSATSGGICTVKQFHEKPDSKQAKRYLSDSSMLWNMGIIIGRARVLLREIHTHAKAVHDLVQHYLATNDSMYYQRIDPLSIDYAVIEKSCCSAVLPVDFAWSDVGTLDTFLKLQQQVASPSNVIEHDAHNNLVDVADKLVALVGVDDLCVVEQDDVLVIVKKSQSDRVRSVVAQLRREGREHVC